jgi:hypothetical protein
VNCLDFDRMLDLADPTALAADAREHARSCERCAQALQAAQALDLALARVLMAPTPEILRSMTPALPADFADRVLARVRSRDTRAVALAEPGPFPWWLEACAHPASVLACSVLALVLWKGRALEAFVRASVGEGSPAAAGAVAVLTQAAAWCAPLANTYERLMAQGWTGQLAAGVMLLTVAAIAGRLAFRASERLTWGVETWPPATCARLYPSQGPDAAAG